MKSKIYWFFKIKCLRETGMEWQSGTYITYTKNDLKYWIKNYFPPGDGERKNDLRTLTIMDAIWVSTHS